MHHHNMQVGVRKICIASLFTNTQFETISKTVKTDLQWPSQAKTSKKHRHCLPHTLSEETICAFPKCFTTFFQPKFPLDV